MVPNLSNRREQVTQTIYDQPYPGFVGSPVPATVIAQRNLRNRVSYVSYTDNYLTSAFNQATFYTYDILGNVDTLLQDYGCDNCGTQATYNMMNRNGNRRKKITYQYDLVSGKVNMMLYQNGWNDMWLHRYSYDAENRLVLVETSNDSLVWEKEARYEYYRHGPLARTVLGDQLVQGIDYAYTLQGWLKGVNSTGATATHDMGGDGRAGSLNLYTARDALGFNLNYFGGDYTSINGTVTPFPKYYGLTSGGLPDSLYRPLYNGNISSMATNIRMLRNQYGGQSLFYNYKYDQLNRITRQDVHKNFDRVNNHYNALDIRDSLFRERIAYDANGNILKYHRYNSGGDSEMDSLTYKYYAGTNQLRQIRDSVRSGKFGSNSWEVIVDIDDQPDNNYVYDEIGNIIRDSAEKITSIQWNVYGKITEITRDALATDKNKTTRVRYTYDAAGNRISKVEEKAGTTTKDYTWYARDAQGNIIALYRGSGNVDTSTLQNLGVTMSEQMIYGSSRLGMYGAGAGVDNTNQGPVSRQFYGGGFFERGRKQYELSNHLGNVLTTISDKKIGVSSGAIGSLIDYYEPDIVSAADYYPFGMVSRVGQTTTGVPYRFGFNGKENDNEVKDKFNQQDYGMRIYDPRVGRFLSVDPITKDYPWYTPYQFAGNKPIRFIDIDGAEEGVFPKLKEYGFGGIFLVNSDDIKATLWGGVDDFNRTINPLGIAAHGIYGTAAGKDLVTGQSVDRITAFTDMGVNAIMLFSGTKFSAGISPASKLEKQMAANTFKTEGAAANVDNNVNVLAEQQVASATNNIVQTPGQVLRTPGGKRITNSQHAGGLNPQAATKGFQVQVKANGYPEFGGYLYGTPFTRTPGLNQILIEMTGNYADDFAAANSKAGFGRSSNAARSGFIPETPEGYTWHHTEKFYYGADKKIYNVMELVETGAHDAARHSGGAQLYREATRNPNAYKQ